MTQIRDGRWGFRARKGERLALEGQRWAQGRDAWPDRPALGQEKALKACGKASKAGRVLEEGCHEAAEDEKGKGEKWQKGGESVEKQKASSIR